MSASLTFLDAAKRRSLCESVRGRPVLSSHFSPGFAPHVGQRIAEASFCVVFISITMPGCSQTKWSIVIRPRAPRALPGWLACRWKFRTLPLSIKVLKPQRQTLADSRRLQNNGQHVVQIVIIEVVIYARAHFPTRRRNSWRKLAITLKTSSEQVLSDNAR